MNITKNTQKKQKTCISLNFILSLTQMKFVPHKMPFPNLVQQGLEKRFLHLEKLTSTLNLKKWKTFMKIEKFNLLHLRNDAHFRFHTEFRDIVEEETSESLKIKSQFDTYQPFYERVAWRFDKTADETNIVHKKARAELDKIYRGIVERLNALMVIEGDAAYEQFAKKLNAVIEKYAVKKISTIKTEVTQ